MPALKALAAAVAIAALSIGSASADCNGGYAPKLTINGAVTTPKTYSLADLRAMTPSKLTVSWYSGRDGLVTESYIGVPLFDLITAAGVVTNPKQKNDILRATILATASDCYQAMVAMAEIMPNFGGEQAMVAYAYGDGTPLGPDEGMVRLIMPGDKSGGRDIYSTRTLTVRIPTDAPQASAATSAAE